MFPRLAALAVLIVSTLLGQSVGQSEGSHSTELLPDENDAMVLRAKENLETTKKLISLGALPTLRLRKAQEDLQDAEDLSILKKSIYDNDLLPEQVDQMIFVAQRMVVRREHSMAEMQKLIDAGVISRSEAEMTGADLMRAQSELEAAQSRAHLIEQLAESVKIEKLIAGLENEAASHPEWAGKRYLRYDGNGIFTPQERREVEMAYIGKFLRPLPVSAEGETAVHRSLGFDHRGRIDVALNPDQPEGLWLMHYLESKHIPYFAFRTAIPGKATGAHIHLGPQSTRLAF